MPHTLNNTLRRVLKAGQLLIVFAAFFVGCSPMALSINARTKPVAVPAMTPGAGTYTPDQSIGISCSTEGASIYYTTNGENPTVDSSLYTGAIPLADKGSSLVLKAFAVKDGMKNSDIATASYVIEAARAATPAFSPAAGTYAADISVTLSTTTSGAAIYYTTDGSTPTAASTPYSGGIPVAGDGRSMTIRAIAIRAGMTASAIGSAAYVIRYPTGSSQIIADHTAVDRYSAIPAKYLAMVKKMWVEVSGESHSEAYRVGLQSLENQNGTYAVSIQDGGSPQPYTDLNLRMSRIFTYGEQHWYTSASAISQLKTSVLDRYGTGSTVLSAIGFGWCWDMTWHNDPGGTVDPVYKCRWGGSSVGGPQGDLRWGLDAGDQSLTGNSVSMDSYLSATQQYIDYCASKGYPTKVFFTTGPVDSYTGENGYQRSVKHEYIRSYVKADPSRILFDYADILCYNDDGSRNLTSWTDGEGTAHQYPVITATNGGSGNVGHIGDAGALRLGKAMWWMLARMAGWDGVSTE